MYGRSASYVAASLRCTKKARANAQMDLNPSRDFIFSFFPPMCCFRHSCSSLHSLMPPPSPGRSSLNNFRCYACLLLDAVSLCLFAFLFIFFNVGIYRMNIFLHIRFFFPPPLQKKINLCFIDSSHALESTGAHLLGSCVKANGTWNERHLSLDPAAARKWAHVTQLEFRLFYYLSHVN